MDIHTWNPSLGEAGLHGGVPTCSPLSECRYRLLLPHFPFCTLSTWENDDVIFRLALHILLCWVAVSAHQGHYFPPPVFHCCWETFSCYHNSYLFFIDHFLQMWELIALLQISSFYLMWGSLDSWIFDLSIFQQFCKPQSLYWNIASIAHSKFLLHRP